MKYDLFCLCCLGQYLDYNGHVYNLLASCSYCFALCWSHSPMQLTNQSYLLKCQYEVRLNNVKRQVVTMVFRLPVSVLLCFWSCFGSRDGAVVRALASHQCGPGSIPGLGFICGLSLLLVLVLAPRGFSPGTLVFPSPLKPTLLNSNSIWIVSFIDT